MTATNELNAANQSMCLNKLTRTLLSDDGLQHYIDEFANAGASAAGKS